MGIMESSKNQNVALTIIKDREDKFNVQVSENRVPQVQARGQTTVF